MKLWHQKSQSETANYHKLRHDTSQICVFLSNNFVVFKKIGTLLIMFFQALQQIFLSLYYLLYHSEDTQNW